MKKIKKLSDVEMEIMQAIWELSTTVTVTEMLDIFKDRGWKNSTVSTLLSRLISKGYLKKCTVGKSNVYTAIITLAEYKTYETKNFITTIHAGDIKSFMASLVDDNNITLEEISELKDWFNDKVGD